MWCLIVSIPDLFPLSYFYSIAWNSAQYRRLVCQCMAFPGHTHLLFDRLRVSWYILENNSKSARLKYIIVAILQCCFVMRFEMLYIIQIKYSLNQNGF